MSAKTQQATGSGAATAPSEEALSKAIGARYVLYLDDSEALMDSSDCSICSIRITTAAPNTSTIEGTLFTACPITNLVAINTSTQTSPNPTSLNQSGNYHIIPASRIQSFQVISPAPTVVDGAPALQALETRALKAREASAVAKLQEAEARRGKGVTREAQDIFDAFSRTMPARWDGTSIVVADAVVIAKPYRVDDCRALIANDSAALTRVRKVVRTLHRCVSNDVLI